MPALASKRLLKFLLSILKFEKSQIIVVTLLTLTVILIIVGSLFGRAAQYLRFGGNHLRQEQAIHLAEAGIDFAIWQLNQTAGNYTGTIEPINLSTGQFTITVENAATQNLKTITSTAFIPDTVNPIFQQTIRTEVEITNTVISFSYAVQANYVDMNQSSTIEGSVHANGDICYPQSNCQGSGQVITGDAWASGQIGDPPTVLGERHPGSPQQPFPNISQQIANWKTAAEAGGTIDCFANPDECNISTGPIGPKKYIGNVTISGNSPITVTGPLWITQNLTVGGGNTQVILADSFGSNGTGIVVGNTIQILNGAAILPNSASPKGYIMMVSESIVEAIRIRNAGANAILYSLVGRAIMENNSTINSLVAWQLTMENNTTLEYDSGLASAQFTTCPACPGGSWQVRRGSYYFP